MAGKLTWALGCNASPPALACAPPSMPGRRVALLIVQLPEPHRPRGAKWLSLGGAWDFTARSMREPALRWPLPCFSVQLGVSPVLVCVQVPPLF